VEAGAREVRSTVRGPTVIGERMRITDSYVVPFAAVHHHYEITGSEIEHPSSWNAAGSSTRGSNLGSPVAVNASGKAAVTVSALSLGLGSHSVPATYGGSGNFLPSTSPVPPQVVSLLGLCILGICL